jgi:hypothetical protein
MFGVVTGFTEFLQVFLDIVPDALRLGEGLLPSYVA